MKAVKERKPTWEEWSPGCGRMPFVPGIGEITLTIEQWRDDQAARSTSTSSLTGDSA